MSANLPSKAYPQVVKLDMAQNLAKAWVKNMSRTDADESSEVDFEARPPSRLGLGAKVLPKSKVTSSTDPVERKLRMKFDAEKKRVAKSLEESNKTNNKSDDCSDNDDDYDPESRASAFIKKRAVFQPTSFPAKKKQR